MGSCRSFPRGRDREGEDYPWPTARGFQPTRQRRYLLGEMKPQTALSPPWSPRPQEAMTRPSCTSSARRLSSTRSSYIRPCLNRRRWCSSVQRSRVPRREEDRSQIWTRSQLSMTHACAPSILDLELAEHFA